MGSSAQAIMLINLWSVARTSLVPPDTIPKRLAKLLSDGFEKQLEIEYDKAPKPKDVFSFCSWRVWLGRWWWIIEPWPTGWWRWVRVIRWWREAQDEGVCWPESSNQAVAREHGPTSDLPVHLQSLALQLRPCMQQNATAAMFAVKGDSLRQDDQRHCLSRRTLATRPTLTWSMCTTPVAQSTLQFMWLTMQLVFSWRSYCQGRPRPMSSAFWRSVGSLFFGSPRTL